jgi:hypothetical protein
LIALVVLSGRLAQEPAGTQFDVAADHGPPGSAASQR